MHAICMRQRLLLARHLFYLQSPMLHPPLPLPRWPARFKPGVLLSQGRFAWWYCLLGLFVLALGVVGASFVQYVWQTWAGKGSLWQHAGVLLHGPVFIGTALLTPLLASGKRAKAQDYPASTTLPGWQIGVVIGMTVAIQIVVAAFEALVPNARQASEQVSRSLGLGQAIWVDVIMVLAIAVLAPVGEEWLFRGLFFRSLRDGLARWLPLSFASSVGIVVSSSLFAVVHVGEGQITQWPALFIMGVLLALTYEWTGSLLAPMMVHALNNTLALLVAITLPNVHFASQWMVLFTLCTPLMVLTLAMSLLRMLPRSVPCAAVAADTAASASFTAPQPEQAMPCAAPVAPAAAQSADPAHPPDPSR